jgi:hypothetical protein
MTNTRIVLSQKYKPLADELLSVTGIDSLSNLFVIFLTRYGSHLKASWNVSYPASSQGFNAVPIAYSTTGNLVTQGQLYNHLNEPISEAEPEPDPVITRLAGLIDRF